MDKWMPPQHASCQTNNQSSNEQFEQFDQMDKQRIEQF